MTEGNEQRVLTPEEEADLDSGLIWHYVRAAREERDGEAAEEERIGSQLLAETLDKHPNGTLQKWLEHCFDLEGEIERVLSARAQSPVKGKTEATELGGETHQEDQSEEASGASGETGPE